MFTVQFGEVRKRKNSTFVPPVSASANVLLKENTSIIRPTFRINTVTAGISPATLFSFNYCSCPTFLRYYFITNITSVTAVIFDIACEVDVMASFRSDILDTDAFILYAESEFNSAISDSRLPKTVDCDESISSVELPITSTGGSFALTLASPNGNGTTGCAQTYILSASQMAGVASKLYDTSFLEEAVKYFTNPLDAVISCKWTPLAQNIAGNGSASIEIGGFSIGSGFLAAKTVEGTLNLSMFMLYRPIPPATGSKDYRNCEPYAEHALWLPGVGLQQIPITPFLSEDGSSANITIKYACSPCTGAITYRLYSPNIISDANVMTISGNFGIDVPVAQRTSGYIPALSNFASAAGNAVMATMINNPLGSTSSAISAGSNMLSGIFNMLSSTTSVSGSLGGWACTDDMYKTIYSVSKYYKPSDAPSNVKSVIGLPLYKKKKLIEMKGFIKCVGAYVATRATNEELDMITNMLNMDGRNGYGGVYIE